jgi:hypothetical protein
MAFAKRFFCTSILAYKVFVPTLAKTREFVLAGIMSHKLPLVCMPRQKLSSSIGYYHRIRLRKKNEHNGPSMGRW